MYKAGSELLKIQHMRIVSKQNCGVDRKWTGIGHTVASWAQLEDIGTGLEGVTSG